VASNKSVTTGIAERYALALYELADEGRALDAVADDLRALKALLAESRDLGRLIRSPVLSRADQGKGIAAVAGKAGLGDLTRRFLGLLARNRRLFALPAIIERYLAELAHRRGEVEAKVSTAVPLSEAQVQAVTQALRQAVGGKVTVDMTVDPSLLGGLVVRLGSRLVDSSLRTRLQRLEYAMKGIG